MQRATRTRTATVLLAAGAVLTLLAAEARSTDLHGGLVHLRRIDPTILQDIRYATPRNFTRSPVPGYDAAECILLRPVAEALSRIQTGLRDSGLSLKVYDCYRPVRAVQAFVRWTRQAGSDSERAYHHPRLPRNRLIPLGYISASSTHSRGDTVDLTLVELAGIPDRDHAPGQGATRTTGAATCTSPVGEREPDSSVDTGTSFDCLDSRSSIASNAVGPTQRRWRVTLKEAMTRGGFKGYDREWWHFTYGLSNHPSWDIPVTHPGP